MKKNSQMLMTVFVVATTIFGCSLQTDCKLGSIKSCQDNVHNCRQICTNGFYKPFNNISSMECKDGVLYVDSFSIPCNAECYSDKACFPPEDDLPNDDLQNDNTPTDDNPKDDNPKDDNPKDDNPKDDVTPDSCDSKPCSGENEICQDGECVDLCADKTCNGENEICQMGECVDLCADVTCDGENEFCQMGECIDVDANGNHMLDEYENGPNQGIDCRTDTDCDSEKDAGDGFCDSFLGYKCSTRCISEAEQVEQVLHVDQCVNENYFCRPDGRCAPKVFETIWETTSLDEEIQLPKTQSYDMDIDWGDGSPILHATNGDEQELSHVYHTKGKKHVKITGSYNWSLVPSDFDYPAEFAKKLYAIKSYGPVAIRSNAFVNASSLTSLSEVDIPDATKLANNSIFKDAKTFNLNVENWDVSYLTKMNSMFSGASKFNQPLNHWDTSSVTLMKYMFTNASAFNQDLNDWDTSHVTNMDSMFYDAHKFNGVISNWDVSKVTIMRSMFKGAKAFNQDITAWDISSCNSIYGMFFQAKVFDQALPDWNITKVNSIVDLFKDSGISKENYCKTISGQYASLWNNNKKLTGVNYTCP